MLTKYIGKYYFKELLGICLLNWSAFNVTRTSDGYLSIFHAYCYLQHSTIRVQWRVE